MGGHSRQMAKYVQKLGIVEGQERRDAQNGGLIVGPSEWFCHDTSIINCFTNGPI